MSARVHNEPYGHARTPHIGSLSIRSVYPNGHVNRHRDCRRRPLAAARRTAPGPWRAGAGFLDASLAGRSGVAEHRRMARNVGDHVADAAYLAVLAPDQVGYQAGPAGLVRGAKAGPGVTVEILAEKDVVAPGGIGLQPVRSAEARAAAVRAAGEEGN